MELEKASKPDYIPNVFWSIYLDMHQRQKLGDRGAALFLDSRLIKFWEMISNYLSSVNPVWQHNVAGFLVGSFLNPLTMHAKSGTVDRPTVKVNIRNAQKEADKLFEEIADLAGQLTDKLSLVEETTRYYPCELHLKDLLDPLLGDKSINDDIYYRNIHTAQVLDLLWTAFRDYPKTDDLFSSVPGMSSQKSSWRDWLAEARNNLDLMLDTYPGDFKMKEIYWVNLAKALINESINRPSVQAALKER
jgi:hypothetical protein